VGLRGFVFRFGDNLQKHRFWLASKKKWVTLRVSAHGLRIINARGIEKVYSELQRAGEV